MQFQSYCKITYLAACYVQGQTEGFSKKTISLNSLTIMNGAKLTAADTDTSSPTVNVLLHESLRVMAGGLIQGKWINISAGDIEVEASGVITAEKRGFAATIGPGRPSGITKFHVLYFSPSVCPLYSLIPVSLMPLHSPSFPPSPLAHSLIHPLSHLLIHSYIPSLRSFFCCSPVHLLYFYAVSTSVPSFIHPYSFIVSHVVFLK